MRLFMEDATGVSVPIGVVTQYSRFHSNQALSRVKPYSALQQWERNPKVPLAFESRSDFLRKHELVPQITTQHERNPMLPTTTPQKP